MNAILASILASLLNAAIPTLAIAAAVWLVLRLAPRRAFNAATRYAIWWTVLLLAALLPLFYLPRPENAAAIAGESSREVVSTAVPLAKIVDSGTFPTATETVT